MKRETLMRHGRDLAGIMLGSAINACATTFFVTSCGLVPGGVTGVATIIHRLSGFPLGGGVFIISGFILVAGLILMGRESFAKTLFCIAAYSGFLEIASRVLPAFGGSLWISALVGGSLIGLGLGIILACGGSLGTTDLIGQILHKHFGISVSGAIMVMDVIPMVVGAMFFGAGTLIYAVVCLFMVTRVIALLQPKSRPPLVQK